MIVELAAAMGHRVDDPEALATTVLSVLAIDAGVTIPDRVLAASQAGSGTPGEIPRESLGHLNREIGGRVVKRFARRRVRTLLGRELPFGVGLAIGGISDYRTVNALGRTAIKHLRGT